jgi:hypothetical protein
MKFLRIALITFSWLAVGVGMSASSPIVPSPKPTPSPVYNCYTITSATCVDCDEITEHRCRVDLPPEDRST